MSSLRTFGALALCAGLLAACSKPAGGGHAPSAAAPGGEVVIGQSQLPHPRAGAWEMVMTSEGAPMKSRICVTDKPFNIGRMRALCQSFVFHRTPAGGIVIDSRCASHGVASTMHLTAQGDFQSAYATDLSMTITLQPGQPPRTIVSHTDYRYVGPCSASEEADVDRAMSSHAGG